MNISDDMVEAASRAFYNDPNGLTDWDRLAKVSPEIADRYRDGMRRALTAALTAALSSTPEASDDERALLKHAIEFGPKWSETNETLGYVPPGVIGMYADAVLAAGFRLASRPTPPEDVAATVIARIKRERTRLDRSRDWPDREVLARFGNAVETILDQEAAALAPVPADRETEKIALPSREALIEALNAPTHAPMDTHSQWDGSCTQCPVAVHMLAPEEIADHLIADLGVQS